MVVEGDTPAARALFDEHVGLVRILARQLVREVGRFIEFDELVSFGMQGLLQASRRFDASRGIPFKRYAHYRIRGAMIDGIRKVAMPRRAHERIRALQSALFAAEARSEDAAGGPAPANPTEADARLTEHLADMATALAVGLLPTPGMGDEGEEIAVAAEASPEEATAHAELRRIVREALADLPDDERALVERHYLNGERFDHVSASLGLSKSWGSRLHSRAVRRLTEKLRGLVE